MDLYGFPWSSVGHAVYQAVSGRGVYFLCAYIDSTNMYIGIIYICIVMIHEEDKESDLMYGLCMYAHSCERRVRFYY